MPLRTTPTVPNSRGSINTDEAPRRADARLSHDGRSFSARRATSEHFDAGRRAIAAGPIGGAPPPARSLRSRCTWKKAALGASFVGLIVGVAGGLVLGGTAKGALIGAAIGSALPGVGTVIGAVVGAFGGGLFAAIVTGALTGAATGTLAVAAPKGLYEGGKLLGRGGAWIGRTVLHAWRKTPQSEAQINAILQERATRAVEKFCRSPEDEPLMKEYLETVLKVSRTLPEHARRPCKTLSQAWIDHLATRQLERIDAARQGLDPHVYAEQIRRQQELAETACRELIQLLVDPSSSPSSQDYAEAFANATCSAAQYTNMRLRHEQDEMTTSADAVAEDLDAFLAEAWGSSGISKATAHAAVATALERNEAFQKFNQLAYDFSGGHDGHPGNLAFDIFRCVRRAILTLAPQPEIDQQVALFQRSLEGAKMHPRSDVEHFTNLVLDRYGECHAYRQAAAQLDFAANPDNQLATAPTSALPVINLEEATQ